MIDGIEHPGYALAAAKILVAALHDAGVRTVDREDLRTRWYKAHPQHDRQKYRTEGAKVRHRRATYLSGKHHNAGRTAGRRGRLYLTRGLKGLVELGIIRMTETHVTVLDVPRLVKLTDE